MPVISVPIDRVSEVSGVPPVPDTAAAAADPAASAARLSGFPLDLAQRASAARERARALVGLTQRILDDLERAAEAPNRDEQLVSSPVARLQARLETMPVIEQAKGLIIAEQPMSHWPLPRP
jgi:uncharacterized membrane protein YccC